MPSVFSSPRGYRRARVRKAPNYSSLAGARPQKRSKQSQAWERRKSRCVRALLCYLTNNLFVGEVLEVDMKIGVSGASGHLGRAVVSELLQRRDGHEVVACLL